jgi:hypothetical protein
VNPIYIIMFSLFSLIIYVEFRLISPYRLQHFFIVDTHQASALSALREKQQKPVKTAPRKEGSRPMQVDTSTSFAGLKRTCQTPLKSA